MGLCTEPEHALVVFVNRKNPVVFAVFRNGVLRDRFAVITPNDAAENREPHRPVITSRTRNEAIVFVLLMSAQIANSWFFLIP